jgi:hypothetical protein
MSISILSENVDALIGRAVSWASSTSDGRFNGESEDGATIRLCAKEFLPIDGVFYSAIEIVYINIPKMRQRQGLYKSLLKEIDALNKFGVRRHDTTRNDWLIKHHRQHGYSEDQFGGNSPSFWLIIGKPLDIEKQQQLHQISFLKKFPRGRPRSNGGLIPRKSSK